MSNLPVANIIVEQLGRSTSRMSAMIGAHTFTGSNCVRVTLDPNDTYTVEFLSLRGPSLKVKGSFEGMHGEDLKALFERETGLYLSL